MLNSKISKHKHYQMQKKNKQKHIYQTKNIYKNTKIYCPQEKSQNQNTKNNTNTDSYIHIRYKKKYTQHIKYTKQKNIHQKSPTHTKK